MMTVEGEPHRYPHWRRNLWVCVTGSFTTIVGMTILLPFLPLYVAELGAETPKAVAQWSGIAYGATFLSAAFVAPLWGRLADRYGQKIMLLRASLGMAVAIGLMGMVTTVWQLVLLRLLTGLLGGYASGSVLLVAAQAPKARSGWALGMLSSGIMAGNLIGPLVGGIVPNHIGVRNTFLLTAAVIFVAFLATAVLIREPDRQPGKASGAAGSAKVSLGAARVPILAMLATGTLLMVANMSIEPIITIYIAELVSEPHVTTAAGITMSATALGSILSASRLGKLADRIGHWTVITAGLAAAAFLLIPQAFVTEVWQLVGLRFLMGVALGGLLPCIAAVIRHSAPEGTSGRYLGLSTSAQYAGQVVGPVAGGFFAGHFGMRAVFFGTAALMALGALANLRIKRKAA
jgi:MFS family permease